MLSVFAVARSHGVSVAFVVALSAALTSCASDAGGVSPLAVRELMLHAPKTIVEVGEPLMLSVTARDGRDSLVANLSLVWSAEPAAIATVSDGMVTTHAPGTVVISATSGTVTSHVTLDVRPARAVVLSLSSAQSQLAPAQSTNVTAMVRDARNAVIANANVVWRSTDPRVLTVTAQGAATGVSQGVAYVVATADDLRDSVPLSVVASSVLTIVPDDVDVAVNAQRTLSARFRTDNGVDRVAVGVLWSSSNSQIATVSNGTVVGVAPGITTISATAGTLQATATVRVAQVYGDFISTTPLSGVQGVIRADNITVGDVVAAGPLTLIATRDISLTGHITATCYPLTLIAGGQLQANVNVSIDNYCNTPGMVPPDPAPPLRLVAGGFALAYTRLTSTGDVTVTNDPTIILSDFDSDQANRSIDQCRFSELFIEHRYPTSMPPGAADAAGRNGAHVDISCRGTMRVGGSITTAGGTNAADISQMSRAVGATGGNSGTIRLRTTGDLVVGGTLTLTVPASGRGGDATATAMGKNGNAASAVGGNGGDIGSPTRPPVEILVAGSVIHIPTWQDPLANLMRINVANAGNGGSAFATGGQGADATNELPAGIGGDASAVGGNGGRTFPIALPAPTTFDINKIKRNGFGGGNGGNAVVSGGPGGNGSSAFPNGGPGGSAIAFGGNGSNVATVPNVSFAIGGSAGYVQLSGGRGGQGFDRCAPVGTGGKGGAGGTVAGAAGRPGIGMVVGNSAFLEIWGAGIGGAGGKGVIPGTGGTKGSDHTVNGGTRIVDALSFAEGPPGTKCQ